MAAEKIIDAVGGEMLILMVVMFGFVLWWAFRKPAGRDGDSGGSDGGNSGFLDSLGDGNGDGGGGD